MAKRLAVLAAVLVWAVLAAAPAVAQQGHQYDQYGGDRATLLFELTVEGEPPADATFFGNVRTGEGGRGCSCPSPTPTGMASTPAARPWTGSGPGPGRCRRA